jgi:vacuolar protein sorting-associated protein IST1
MYLYGPYPAFSTQEPDPAVSEGICSIIYAAPRTELKGA